MTNERKQLSHTPPGSGCLESHSLNSKSLGLCSGVASLCLTLSTLQSSSFSLQRSGEAWSTKGNLSGVWRLSKRSPSRTRKTETARKAERNGRHPASDCSRSWAGSVETQRGAEAGKGGRPHISRAGPQQVSWKAEAKAGPCSLHRWQKVSAFLSVFYRFLSITGKDLGYYK